MAIEVVSSEIISECLKQHGQGALFCRTDGLQFEEQRAQVRLDHLASHPETKEEYREAILKAAVTPA